MLTQTRVDQLEAIDSNVQHRKTVLGLHRNPHQGIAQMPTKSGEIPQPRQLIKEQRTLSLPLPIKSSEGSLNAGLQHGRGLVAKEHLGRTLLDGDIALTTALLRQHHHQRLGEFSPHHQGNLLGHTHGRAIGPQQNQGDGTLSLKEIVLIQHLKLKLILGGDPLTEHRRRGAAGWNEHEYAWQCVRIALFE